MSNEKKNLTELVMILDRSGSMSGLETDTIGGYNGMLEKQRAGEGDVLVTTVLFDDRTEVLHDRVPIAQVRPITANEYYVRGCTALLDALGGTIDRIATIHKYAREEDRPDKTIFIITTDGYENASRQYDYAAVKRLVEQKKEADHWEFLFLGANIDAVAAAGNIGIRADRAVNYHADSVGTAKNFAVLERAVSAVRAAPCASGQMLQDDWADEIREDYAGRSAGARGGHNSGSRNGRSAGGRGLFGKKSRKS